MLLDDYFVNGNRLTQLNFSFQVTPQHGRKARQSAEDSTDDTGFLHCDICNFNEGEKKAFIRHLESGKHVRREQQAAQSSKPVQSSEEVQARPGKVQARNSPDENVEKPVSLKKQETVKGRPLDESRYGRKRKKNKAFARKSCVYTTPEFDEEEQDEKTPEAWKEKPKKKRKPEKENSKPEQNAKANQTTEKEVEARTKKMRNVSDSSLRRVVLDKAARSKALLAKPAPSPPKPIKSTEEILAKISVNPKTVKQRKANMDAMEEYNENHEDDMFGGGASITAVKSKGSLFKPSSKTLLADTDSDDDQDVTLCSAKTPVTAYLDNKERRERLLDHMKTPAELVQTLSPMMPRPTG